MSSTVLDDDGFEEAYPGADQDTNIAVAIYLRSRDLPENDHKGFLLDCVSPMLWGQAIDAIDEGDIFGVLCSMPDENNMVFFSDNMAALRANGWYEEALLDAHMGTRLNNRNIDYALQRAMWKMANKEKIWTLCDELPSAGPFTIYRGVVGLTEEGRCVHGMSWTSDFEVAKFFADRIQQYSKTDLNPVVYQTTVEKQDVMAYLDSGFRDEKEFIVHIRPHHVITEM